MNPGEAAAEQPRELALIQLWETLATVAKAAFFFLATPVLIARLGREGYGLLALALSVVACVVGLDLGLRPYLRVALSSLQADASARSRLLAEVLGAFLVVQVLALVVVFAGARAHEWSRLFQLPAAGDRMLVVALACGSAYALSLLLIEPLAARHRLSLVKAASFCGYALAVPVVIALAQTGAGATACFLGFAAALTAPNLLLALVYEPRALAALLRARPRTLGRIVFSGRWFALFTAQWLARSYLLTFLVSALFGPAEAGTFFILLKLSELLSVFGANTSEAAIAGLASEPDRAARRVRFLGPYRTTLAVSVAAFGGLAALTPWVLRQWFHLSDRGATVGVLVGLFGLAGGFDRAISGASMGLGLIRHAALWSLVETAVALGGAIALRAWLGIDGVFLAGAVAALALFPTAGKIAHTLGESASTLWVRPALPFFAGVVLAGACAVFAAGSNWPGMAAAVIIGALAGWRCLRP